MTLQEPHREPRRPATGKPNFRDIAVKLLAENKDSDPIELVPAYANALRRNSTALESLCEFALLHVKATMREPDAPRKRNGRNLVIERKKRALTTAKAIVKNLMEYKTPYGKATADCTGEELWKLGGWYRALSKLAGGRNSKSTLRDKGATETDLQQALRSS